jgi:hypothetical protein
MIIRWWLDGFEINPESERTWPGVYAVRIYANTLAITLLMYKIKICGHIPESGDGAILKLS